MMMDAKKLSEVIRMKKKKMLEADPELIDTSPVPDMNAQDVYDMEKKGYIEGMVKADPKINAEDAELDMPSDEAIQMMDKMRMERLRKYMDTLDVA